MCVDCKLHTPGTTSGSESWSTSYSTSAWTGYEYEFELSGLDQAALAALQSAEEWERFPTIEQYREKWLREEAKHVKCIPGEFSRDNLVPAPNPILMQDVPWVPFDRLKSEDAQARLSVCRPLGSLRESGIIGGVPTYAQSLENHSHQ